MINFVGKGTPLTQAGLDAALVSSNVAAPALWSVIAVETSGSGFLSDRRPKILFERHIFSRLTKGQYDADDPDVSSPIRGGYGPGGANQYLRLAAAMQLDQDAALQSASWGLGQIMGENWKQSGFTSVADMVTAFVGGEDAQLGGMAGFLQQSGMTGPLKGQDWAGFARLYNGPSYAAHNYDGQLQHFFQIYSAGPLPDLTVRAVQICLIYRGFDPGTVDGVVGPATNAAIRAFQASIGVAQTGAIDDNLTQELFT